MIIVPGASELVVKEEFISGCGCPIRVDDTVGSGGVITLKVRVEGGE